MHQGHRVSQARRPCQCLWFVDAAATVNPKVPPGHAMPRSVGMISVYSCFAVSLDFFFVFVESHVSAHSEQDAALNHKDTMRHPSV